MKKSTLFRLFCLALLAVPASFGAFNLTAQPAHALQCSQTFLGCGFSHVGEFGNAICCVYVCPNGSQRTGVCEPI
jgi:hypothetical protein